MSLVKRLREWPGYLEDRLKAADRIEELENLYEVADRERSACREQRYALHDRIEQLEAALREIEQWSRAYPLNVFPEPDLKKATEVLKSAGMTLDSISASAMRHVITQVGGIARRALEGK